MKIGTLLVYLVIVSCIVFVLYYVYLKQIKRDLSNSQGEFIIKDASTILNTASQISSYGNDEKTKKEIEEKVNKLMKKYSIN